MLAARVHLCYPRGLFSSSEKIHSLIPPFIHLTHRAHISHSLQARLWTLALRKWGQRADLLPDLETGQKKGPDGVLREAQVN